MAPTKGWINYDNSPAVRLAQWPSLTRILHVLRILDAGNLEFVVFCGVNGIRYANAISRIPHASKSLDVVYSSHMIEHLDRVEAKLFLRECQRVLKPGGILRVVAPDLRVTVNDYVTKGNADKFLLHLQLDLDKPHGLRSHISRLLLGGRNHHWMYDAKSLSGLLSECGYRSVQVLDPGQTGIAEPGTLNLHERAGESIYLEAKNP